ncbi:hypothetical protein UFOVP319_42 [uncultured Caudovirales phage]|uniref:Uncharacterized protein n=1 Tax=uncultured Caudovirales phage TaxID=2100421 RepID=A0A6J5M0M9_9CAUD|nr:hypothetical protein UFOVP319_42 [uncultured Caudovirales phage]
MDARFIATADPSDDAECTVFGVTFVKGKWQKVADDIGLLLSTNQTFEVREGKAKADGKE